MSLDIRFRVGHIVFGVGTEYTSARFSCPDCKETREWTATSKAGEVFRITCLRCAGQIQNGPSLTYTRTKFNARKLTIGSIRVDTADKKTPIAYMCRETGVGSGRIWSQKELFDSERDALYEASRLTAIEDEKRESSPKFIRSKDLAFQPLGASFRYLWNDDRYESWRVAEHLRSGLHKLLQDEILSAEAIQDLLQDVDEAEHRWLKRPKIQQLVEAVLAHEWVKASNISTDLSAEIKRVTRSE